LKAGNANNLALALFPTDVYAMGEPAQVYPRKAADAEGAVRRLVPPECRDWTALLQDEFVVEGAKAVRQRLDEGNALHAVLSMIKTMVLGQEEALVRDVLSRDGSLKALVDEKALVAALSDARIQKFFNPDVGEVYCEYSLVDKTGNTHRLDRLIVTPHEVIVVDFKTGGVSQDGLDQVRTYMELLKQIYPGRVVKGCLVFINEKNVMEV
jgi:hypothetical protein